MRSAILLIMIPWGGWAAGPPLEELLRRTGTVVEQFADQFASVNCTESVAQVKLGENGKMVSRRESAYDYLALADAQAASVEESRVAGSVVKQKGKRAPLLATSGFPLLLFVLHPRFQGSFEYAPPEEDVVEGRRVLRVGFRQVHGAPSPSVLRLRGRDYPLEWRGAAWIERESGAVIRISAELLAGMEDLGLRALSADVRYAPVRFKDSGEARWLPVVARIEAVSAKQRWQNEHRLTNYRQFSVSTSSRTEAPR